MAQSRRRRGSPGPSGEPWPQLASRMAAATFSTKVVDRHARGVPVLRDHVLHARPRSSGVVRSSIASTWFAGSLSTACAFCAQASMRRDVHVDAHRDRALLLVELDLASSGSSMTSASLSCVASCAVSLVAGKTNTSPPITSFGALADDGAAVFLAGGLAGRVELALGPVAHELHGRLVGDHEGGGVVPVAARAARIDEAAQLAEQLGDLLELRVLHRVLARGRRRACGTGRRRRGRRARRGTGCAPRSAGRRGRAG